MNKTNFIYRLKSIFISILVWELFFWLIFFALIYSLGYGSESRTIDQLAFKYPLFLSLSLLLIPIIGVYFYKIRQNNQIAVNTNENVLQFVLKPVSSFFSLVRFIFFRNAFVFLVITLAQPIYGKKKVHGLTKSLELVVALDISNSMNSKDLDKDLSRLEVSKRALNQLVNNLHGEKIGISIFAGNAYVQLPITSDYHAAKMFISEIETEMISNQGTNIAEALATSVKMFSAASGTKGIILVTDGENHEENPVEAIKSIIDKNIELCVLGVGTINGGLIPKDPKRTELGYKMDERGENIISKLNPSFINELAKKTNGFSMLTTNAFPDLAELLLRINQMDSSKMNDDQFDVIENRYQIPLFLAIVFWLLFILLPVKLMLKFDNLIHKK